MRLFKKVIIPSGEQSELLAYESWSVKWESLSGNKEYSSLIRPKLEAEVFTSKEDAELFATALRDAFRLLKYSGTVSLVEVTKNTQWKNSKTATQ